ncbi:hypothetical protein [Telmatospirillum sp.]|uniref:hypothetical protein n=1 Tax=Telmatospirillum sp. TaxID=2079197 RepID=UPI0028436AE4|nr:hypothetical protein [Telmatospirillum sp.]MDR3439862.1 hypothetical protein [Telmatospirillum sp.]
MKTAFEKMYALRRRIEALKAEHIVPLSDEVTATKRDLKASANMATKDIDLVYRLYERWCLAAQLEDELEGKRIQDNIRRAFSAARRGEIINFLDVLDGATISTEPQETENGFEDEVAAAEEQVTGGAPFETAGQTLTASEEQAPAPAADWGDDKAPVPAEQDDGSQDGFAFNMGEKAGLEGQLDVKALIRAQGWNGRSQRAKNFAAGHAQGVKKRQQAANQPMTDEEAYEITNAGNKAGYEGKPLSANPHDSGSDQAERWAAGHEGGCIRRQNEEASNDDTPGLNPLPPKVVNLGDHRPAFPG